MFALVVLRKVFLNDPLGGSFLIVTILFLLDAVSVGEVVAGSSGEPFDDRLLIKS